MNEKLKEIVNNKTVAVVGPSSNIEKYDDGEFIDSHDVVIRLNDASTDKKHRGEKTDVVYIDGSGRRIETIISNIDSYFIFSYPSHVWFFQRMRKHLIS